MQCENKKIYMRLGDEPNLNQKQEQQHQDKEKEADILKEALKENIQDEVLESLIDEMDFSLVDGMLSIQVPEPSVTIFLEALKGLKKISKNNDMEITR